MPQTRIETLKTRSIRPRPSNSDVEYKNMLARSSVLRKKAELGSEETAMLMEENQLTQSSSAARSAHRKKLRANG